MPTTLKRRKRSRRVRSSPPKSSDFPNQQEYWSEHEYLDNSTNRLVEFDDGLIEVLPMPSILHQLILKRLLSAIGSFVRRHKLGEVFPAPLPLWTGVRKYREPDLIFVSNEKLSVTWKRDRKLDQADLVIEILGEGKTNRERDLVRKKSEYATARIPEYWIVDRDKSRVTVFCLRHGKYIAFGEFAIDDEILSAVLPEFKLAVNDLF